MLRLVSVTVDHPAIRDAWQLEDGGTVTLVLTGQPADPYAAATAVEQCVNRVNQALETSYLDLDDMPTWGRGGTWASQGVVWEVESQHPKGPSGWLDHLAKELEAAGLSGRISLYEWPQERRLDELGSGLPARRAAVVLATSGWTLFNERAMHPAWRTDLQTRAALIDCALRFLGSDDGVLELHNDQAHVEVRQRDLEPMITAAFDGDRSYGVGNSVEVHKFGLAENRAVSFESSQCNLVFNVVTTEGLLRDAVTRMCDVATSVSSLCDWAALIENGIGDTYQDVIRNGRGEKIRERKLRTDDASTLPDASGWQIVNGTHLSAIETLDGWDTGPVAPDRYHVTSRNLDAWLALPQPPPTVFAGPSEPSGLLLAARRDFGAALQLRRRRRPVTQEELDAANDDMGW
jgi:hypothetical protein